MTRLELNVNGRKRAVRVEPREMLLYVLRNDLALRGPRFGCGLGQCGACTVLIDGAPARSCIVPVSGVAGRRIVTLEGLGTRENPHPIQKAFIDEQAAQCGYCTNGMIVTAAALLNKNPHPSDDQIKQALARNLCGCGTHLRIVRAVRRAAEEIA